MTHSRYPLSITKLKVRSTGVIKIQSLCSHIIVVMAVSEQEPFSPSHCPLAVTVMLGHLIDCHPRQI